MPLTKILRKPRRLWSRFAEWKAFHSRYGLAAVVVYISTGRWQSHWNWHRGESMPWGSRGPRKYSVYKLTPYVQLTLVRYYASRAHFTTESDGVSKQVRR